MKKSIGKVILGILLSPFTFILNSCSPLGEPVNPQISKNHYFNKNNTDVIWSRQGNWFAIGKTAMQVDVQSFEVLNSTLSKDQNQIYYYSKPINQNDISIEHFYIKEGDLNEEIGFDDKHVYMFTSEGTGPNAQLRATIIKNANPTSYSYYDIDWAKDDKNYYYRNQKVPVDFKSFEHLNQHYSVDKDSCYAHINGNFYTITQANKESFDILKDSYYAYDANTIFYLNYPENASEDSAITAVKASTTKDAVLLSQEYLKCNDQIYFVGKPLKNVDAQNFEVIGRWYGKDKTNVYYKDQLLPEADAATFSLQEEGYGVKDKFGTYREGMLEKEPTN